jgi:hypothetical protein
MKLSDSQLAALKVLGKGIARMCSETGDYGIYRHVRRVPTEALIRRGLARSTQSPLSGADYGLITDEGREVLAELGTKAGRR